MGLPPQVKKGLKKRPNLPGVLALAALALLAVALPRARGEPMPSAREVMRLVRANEAGMNQRFSGRLTTSSSRSKIVVPFQLTMREGTFVYQFVGGPPESLTLRLGENSSRLERSTGTGKGQVVSGAKLDDPVRGTDITYEDLALKFLYWNNARVVGQETLLTRRCWVVQAQPSGRDDSQYDMVRLWVEKTGGLLRAECYSGGKIARRFDVRSVQRAPGGGYVLKTLTVQSLNGPGGPGRDRSPTRLELTPI